MTVVNLKHELLDKKGKPILDDSEAVRDADGKILTPKEDLPKYTLGDLFIDMLTAIHKGDENATGKEKKKRYRLFQKISRHDGDEIELNPKEIVLLGDLVDKSGHTLIVGQVCDILGLDDE